MRQQHLVAWLCSCNSACCVIYTSPTWRNCRYAHQLAATSLLGFKLATCLSCGLSAPVVMYACAYVCIIISVIAQTHFAAEAPSGQHLKHGAPMCHFRLHSRCSHTCKVSARLPVLRVVGDSSQGMTWQGTKSMGLHAGIFMAVQQAVARQIGAAHGRSRRAASAVPVVMAAYLLWI